MSTEITTYASSSLESRWNYAQALSGAGELIPRGLMEKGAVSPAKVLLVMETGTMLGIHPVAALQGVNVIEGKATVSPALMSAVVRRAGHLLRVTMAGSLDDLSLAATAELVRKDDPEHPFTVTWTIERAGRAGLLQLVDGKVRARSKADYPGPWEKYTEAMLKARAISEVCREGATDALMGVGYVPEELGAEVNEEGELIQPAAPATTSRRRPAPKASDYKPLALADDSEIAPPEPAPAVAQRDEVVVVQEAAPQMTVDEAVDVIMGPAPVVELPWQDMISIYGLDQIHTVDAARSAWLKARANGHLDRPMEDTTVGPWLQHLAKVIEEQVAYENADPQTGEIQ
jgi:hypothetical protein